MREFSRASRLRVLSASTELRASAAASVWASTDWAMPSAASWISLTVLEIESSLVLAVSERETVVSVER